MSYETPSLRHFLYHKLGSAATPALDWIGLNSIKLGDFLL